MEAKPGDWGLIREHIEEVLAGGNAEFAEYIVCWIAWSIQNPGAPAEVALVLIGEKGAGKGTLVRCLQRIFGAHAFQVTSREEVIGKFNGHLQDCVLFVADEAYWGGDKRCVGRLQGMITETTLPIERKGIDLIQVPNCLHIVMLAEPGWVIPAGRFERRYAALAVSTAKRGDREYFRALHRQIKEGGAEAMFYDLRAMELGDWHPREIPEALLRNPALQGQQGHTLPPWEQWYVMLLHNGKLPGALTKRPNTCFHQQPARKCPRGCAPSALGRRGRPARFPDRSEKAWHRLHKVPHQLRQRLVLPAARGMPQGLGANLRPRQVGSRCRRWGGVGRWREWRVVEGMWRVQSLAPWALGLTVRPFHTLHTLHTLHFLRNINIHSFQRE